MSENKSLKKTINQIQDWKKKKNKNKQELDRNSFGTCYDQITRKTFWSKLDATLQCQVVGGNNHGRRIRTKDAMLENRYYEEECFEFSEGTVRPIRNDEKIPEVLMQNLWLVAAVVCCKETRKCFARRIQPRMRSEVRSGKIMFRSRLR